jgi:hypothetical protein
MDCPAACIALCPPFGPHSTITKISAVAVTQSAFILNPAILFLGYAWILFLRAVRTGTCYVWLVNLFLALKYCKYLAMKILGNNGSESKPRVKLLFHGRAYPHI